MGKIPTEKMKIPQGEIFSYNISSVWHILLEIGHFSFLCQLKVLGHFAKNWFGKKNPVAVACISKTYAHLQTMTNISVMYLSIGINL